MQWTELRAADDDRAVGCVNAGSSFQTDLKYAWFWLVVAVAVVLAVRLLPKTALDPLDAQSIDKAFHIGLASLPSGWRADWTADSATASRLRLVPPDARRYRSHRV